MPRLSKRVSRNRAVTTAPLVIAALLLAAACSSNPSVEATDTTDPDTSSTETSDTTAADGESDETVVVEGEDAAMGEDDDAVTTTSAPTDDATSTTAGVDLGSADLEAALAAGQSEDLKLPFMYVTADQDCAGCADTVSLYYVPGPDKASDLVLEAAYVDGASQDLDVIDPTLRDIDPRLIAERLAAADAAGTLDAFSVDSVSGLITRWTVAGDTVTLRCLQVDTRPVDLRSEVCRDSLIG